MTDHGPYNWREVQALKQALAAANAQIREHEVQAVRAGIVAREAEAAAHAAKQRAADQQARDAEIESTRKGAWLAYLSGPEKIQELAANAFSPAWIANNTPPSGWPTGDGPEMHEYSSVAPTVEAGDDGVVPPLVIRAREMGLDV
jgi:hypothetical protein